MADMRLADALVIDIFSLFIDAMIVIRVNKDK